MSLRVLEREREQPEEPTGAAPCLPPALLQVRWNKPLHQEPPAGDQKGSYEGTGWFLDVWFQIQAAVG